MIAEKRFPCENTHNNISILTYFFNSIGKVFFLSLLNLNNYSKLVNSSASVFRLQNVFRSLLFIKYES